MTEVEYDQVTTSGEVMNLQGASKTANIIQTGGNTNTSYSTAFP